LKVEANEPNDSGVIIY